VVAGTLSSTDSDSILLSSKASNCMFCSHVYCP
jgi:hypothetical protein